MDPYKFLEFSPNPDGSITRLAPTILVPTTQQQQQQQRRQQHDQHDNDNDNNNAVHQNLTVFSKDVPLNTTNKTFLRIFRPAAAVHDPSSSSKLPVIIYFHGGGFVIFSAGTVKFHEFCNRLSEAIPSVIISVDYRLAPENRLPAAYDDAVEAILWVRNQALSCVSGADGGGDPWLNEFADFGRCYLMGSSSGGNITYYAGLRALDHDISPMKIEGLIINQAYFGGEERTNSELRLAEDKFVPLPVNDLMWSLALPVGADRNHKFCNPMVANTPTDKIGRLPRCLVNGYEGDPLVDRQKELATMLKSRGVHVMSFFQDGPHAVELFEPQRLHALVDRIKEFIGVKMNSEQVVG